MKKRGATVGLGENHENVPKPERRAQRDSDPGSAPQYVHGWGLATAKHVTFIRSSSLQLCGKSYIIYCNKAIVNI